MIDGRRERARAAKANPASGDLSTRPTRGLPMWLVRHHISANAITVAGVLGAGVTGMAIAFGWFYVAAGLLVACGLMDTLDGLVAKAAGTTSARGAFFDSVSDRIADGLIFGGLALHYLDGRSPRLALLPIAILVVASIVSYERAKAESLGFVARGGLMERAERLIVLGVALLLHVIMVPLLILLLTLTCTTAIGRFVRVWHQATSDDASSRRSSVGVRSDHWRAEFDAKWQTWRRRSPRTRSHDIVPLSTRLRSVLSTDRVRGDYYERRRRRGVPRTRRHSRSSS